MVVSSMEGIIQDNRGSNNAGIEVDGMWITNCYYKDLSKLTNK